MKFTERERELVKRWVKRTEYYRTSDNTIICLLVLENTYEVVGYDTVTFPIAMNLEVSKYRAKKRALERLDEYVEFYRQQTRNKFHDMNFNG